MCDKLDQYTKCFEIMRNVDGEMNACVYCKSKNKCGYSEMVKSSNSTNDEEATKEEPSITNEMEIFQMLTPVKSLLKLNSNLDDKIVDDIVKEEEVVQEICIALCDILDHFDLIPDDLLEPFIIRNSRILDKRV